MKNHFRTIVLFGGVIKTFEDSYKAKEFCIDELDGPVQAWDCDEEAFNYYMKNGVHDFTINPEKHTNGGFHPNRWLNGRKEQTICFS